MDIASTHGLRTVLHPHYGTLVETIEATRKLLDRSDVNLCLDTGHLALVGDDPMEMLSRFRERVQHVHLKDVDSALAERVRKGTISYHEAVKQGLYPPLGGGHVKFKEIIAELEASGYNGWYVLEQDVALSGEPTKEGGPLQDARASIDFLNRLDD
jgi:inosose dehydratase